MAPTESIAPEVVVKNTFLEVKLEEEEESTPLRRDQRRQRRAKTQPQLSLSGNGAALTEDEVTDSDVAVDSFVSEDGTSEQEEVVLLRAATEQLVLSGRPGAAAEAEAWQPVPQFGVGDLKVIVKNTFLDVDLATPSARRTERCKTAPNKQTPPLADLGFGSEDEEAESGQEEEEEEEEVEPPVERVVTQDWYESPQAWEWVPGKRMPLEPCMAESAQEDEDEEVEPPVERVVTQDWYESPQAWEWVPGMRMPLEPCMVRPTMGVSTLLQTPTPQAQAAAQSGAQPAHASLLHQAALGSDTCGTKSVASAPAKQDRAPEGHRPQIQVQVPPPFILEDVSLSNGDSGFFRVHWTVDARKLRGNDKQVVSPPFEMALGPNGSSVPFKMMIYPKIANSTRPGVSFKTSCGQGYIQLKCEAELSQSVAGVGLRLSLGDGSDDATAPRGPVLHNFLSSGVCGLPRGQEIWDFSAAVDRGSMTFCICLEIAPSKGS